MKTEIVYITDDGQRFTDEDEALEHEIQVKTTSFTGKIHLFDENKKEIPLNNPSKWDYAIYAVFTEIPSTIEAFRDIWLQQFSVFPFQSAEGIYFYNYKTYKWYHAPTVINKILNLSKELQESE